MHANHFRFLIAEQERSIYDLRFNIGWFRAEPHNYERCLHLSDKFAYRSAHNNLFLTLRVIHKLQMRRREMKSRGKEKNELGVPSGKCLRGEFDYLLWGVPNGSSWFDA